MFVINIVLQHYICKPRTRRWINHNKVWNIYREQWKQGKQQKIHTTSCVISKIVQEKECRTSLKELPNMLKIQRYEWCENLETHLLNDDWKTISDENMERRIILCITGAARREIIPFFNWEQHLSNVKQECSLSK